jgi:hypothetical protein
MLIYGVQQVNNKEKYLLIVTFINIENTLIHNTVFENMAKSSKQQLTDNDFENIYSLVTIKA